MCIYGKYFKMTENENDLIGNSALFFYIDNTSHVAARLTLAIELNKFICSLEMRTQLSMRICMCMVFSSIRHKYIEIPNKYAHTHEASQKEIGKKTHHV